MEIKLSDIKKAIEMLLASLDEEGKDAIELEVDYFWEIDLNDIYNPYVEPTDLTLGQLSDNWKFLQLLLKGERGVISYDFNWMAEILRAISYTRLIT